ncbi:MAG: ATP-binding protein [Verrucomicrobia bacterium]|nr:ATP-binding protein [Verrucomicrobiota bacterium]
MLLAHLALGGLLLVWAAEGIPVSEDYILRTWAIDDGLPSNRVTGLTQTPDGYLWVGTLGGLARFDGVRFTTFHAGTIPGLESDRVQAVFTDRDGSLWVGLDCGGVARRVEGQFHVIAPLAPNIAIKWTTTFAQDVSGAVWFGYEAPTKVSRWLNGQLTSYTEQDGLRGGAHQNEVCSTVNGTIWYANTNGCGPFDGKRFQSVDVPGGGGVHLARAGDGGMWAIRGNRLVHYRPDGTQETKADVSAFSVHVIMEDSSGNLWMGTNNDGLIQFRDGHLESIPVEGGAVSSLFEDQEGNLWAGLRTNGVLRLHARRFYLRQIKDGLPDNDTYSVCTDNEGRLWLTGRNSMVARSTDATNHSFMPVKGWPDWARGTMAVHPDPSGGVWLGTLHGLLHSREGSFSRESLHEPITALQADRTGVLWAATIAGPLVRHEAGRDLRMPEAGGLTKVLSLAEDPAGRIWAGTEDGLVFQKSGAQFVPVPLPGAKPGDHVEFIVPDGPNTVWIGAWRGGLYRWRDGRVDRLPGGAGLPADDLRSLNLTAEGDFWVGTARGLLHVARDEIEAVMDGQRDSLHCIAYGRDAGLPSTEFAQGFRGATAKTPDGHLWFATTQGALEITPQEKISGITASLPVLIETVRVGERTMPCDGNSGLVVPPLSGPLEIRYTLAQLSSPERLRFRYRLSGLGDNEWVEVGDQRTVTFTRLPPGAYRIEISAGDVGGTGYSSTPASLAFVVQAAWWETLSFRLAAGMTGILALIWLVRKIVLLRVQARIRKLEQEHALERERTRIARDIHDQLGANLTQIAITSKLLTLDPPESVPAHSRELTAIARHTAESLDEIVWAVNPHYDTLAALIEYLAMFAVDFLSLAKIACEVDVPADLPASPLSSTVRHHLFLAVKEALNNVVKHSGASTVQLQVRQEGEELRVVVADNGRGFEPGGEAAGSNGVRNLGERLKELGGAARFESTPGRGTRVVFTLRLPEKSGP